MSRLLVVLVMEQGAALGLATGCAMCGHEFISEGLIRDAGR